MASAPTANGSPGRPARPSTCTSAWYATAPEAITAAISSPGRGVGRGSYRCSGDQHGHGDQRGGAGPDGGPAQVAGTAYRGHGPNLRRTRRCDGFRHRPVRHRSSTIRAGTPAAGTRPAPPPGAHAGHRCHGRARSAGDLPVAANPSRAATGQKPEGAVSYSTSNTAFSCGDEGLVQPALAVLEALLDDGEVEVAHESARLPAVVLQPDREPSRVRLPRDPAVEHQLVVTAAGSTDRRTTRATGGRRNGRGRSAVARACGRRAGPARRGTPARGKIMFAEGDPTSPATQPAISSVSRASAAGPASPVTRRRALAKQPEPELGQRRRARLPTLLSAQQRIRAQRVLTVVTVGSWTGGPGHGAWPSPNVRPGRVDSGVAEGLARSIPRPIDPQGRQTLVPPGRVTWEHHESSSPWEPRQHWHCSRPAFRLPRPWRRPTRWSPSAARHPVLTEQAERAGSRRRRARTRT